MKLMRATLKTMISAVALSMPFLIVAQTDPLSLKHGVYVENHKECKGAPNAAVIIWDGFGFSALTPADARHALFFEIKIAFR